MWSTTNMDRTLFSTDGQSNYDTSCRANWFYLKLWSVSWPKIIELDEVNTNKNNRTGFPLTAIVRFVQGKEQLISTQETSPVVPLYYIMNSWALFLTSPNEPSVQALHWLWQSQHLDFGGNWFFPTEVIMRGEFGLVTKRKVLVGLLLISGNKEGKHWFRMLTVKEAKMMTHLLVNFTWQYDITLLWRKSCKTFFCSPFDDESIGSAQMQ